MHYALSVLLGCGLLLALVAAIVTDLRARVIPNALTFGIALAAPLWWWAIGLGVWPGAAVQLAVAAVALALFLGAFAIGAMGGGDVKLIAALALWLLPLDFVRMLVWMSLGGGLLTAAMLGWHALRRAAGRPEVPYGVAIALAAMPVFAERYLYHFV